MYNNAMFEKPMCDLKLDVKMPDLLRSVACE